MPRVADTTEEVVSFNSGRLAIRHSDRSCWFAIHVNREIPHFMNFVRNAEVLSLQGRMKRQHRSG